MIKTSRDIWCDVCGECALYADCFRNVSVKQLREWSRRDGWVRRRLAPGIATESKLKPRQLADVCQACAPDLRR